MARNFPEDVRAYTPAEVVEIASALPALDAHQYRSFLWQLEIDPNDLPMSTSGQTVNEFRNQVLSLVAHNGKIGRFIGIMWDRYPGNRNIPGLNAKFHFDAPEQFVVAAPPRSTRRAAAVNYPVNKSDFRRLNALYSALSRIPVGRGKEVDVNVLLERTNLHLGQVISSLRNGRSLISQRIATNEQVDIVGLRAENEKLRESCSTIEELEGHPDPLSPMLGAATEAIMAARMAFTRVSWSRIEPEKDRHTNEEIYRIPASELGNLSVLHRGLSAAVEALRSPKFAVALEDDNIAPTSLSPHTSGRVSVTPAQIAQLVELLDTLDAEVKNMVDTLTAVAEAKMVVGLGDDSLADLF